MNGQQSSSLQHTQMMSMNKVPMLCRFGGNFIWESNKVYYKEGTNRIVHVDRAINYLNLLSKALEICKLTDVSSIKYKYPGQDLDSLVSIEDDDDVSNMMEAFLCSSDPIHLFVFGAQKLSIPIPIPSNLMQNADSGNDESLLWDLHGSNGTLAHSSHNTNANNNDVSNVSNDLPEMDCLLMDNQELPCRVVDSCVNDMARMIPALKEGQEFEDSNTFLNTEHAICSNFEYKRTKSSMFYYKVKCIKDNCSWRIYACKLLGKPTFKVESLKGNHTCIAANESTVSSKRKRRQASRIWIAGLVKDRLQKNLRCTPKDIVDEISQKYGIKVSYDKAWRGKELTLNEMDFEPIVQALCKKIEMTNPGSTAKLDRSLDNSLRLFVAYKAAIHGFKQACRPIVFLECAEIEGKHRGTRLFAFAMDAEHNRFPISCAFVESEK
ncbi:uncharacterized protein LOC131246865 [Magnolia sinica]|uniref:uncharacterized protein LOC131246865 n=1 Tax=Magnolia sinica TaxID=86752 RepID=UPI00265AD8D9|nr:uncharacterized protein LOC131246865 [Magnolia sinica]